MPVCMLCEILLVGVVCELDLQVGFVGCESTLVFSELTLGWRWRWLCGDGWFGCWSGGVGAGAAMGKGSVCRGGDC